MPTFIRSVGNTPDGKHTCLSCGPCAQSRAANVRPGHIFHTQFTVLSLPASVGLCVIQLFKQKPDSVALIRDLEPSNLNPLE